MDAIRCLGQTPIVHTTYSYVSFIVGGWWTRPSNWKANTAIVFAGILGVSYGVWTVSADKEVSTLLLVASTSVNETWTSSIATMNQSVRSLLCGYVQRVLHRIT